MSDDGQPLGHAQAAQAKGVGCAATVAGINFVLMGVLALAFGHRPYSNALQESWYRDGSFAFLLFGAILPTAIIFLARRFRWVMAAVTAWMCAVLLAFFVYMFFAGGGV